MKKLTVLGAVILAGAVTATAQTFPLRVDLDVSSKTTRDKIGAGVDGEVKVEKVQLRVKIRKSSGEPWPHPVSGELYVIGRQIQTGHYGILDVMKGEGTFSKENDNSFEFTTKTYSLPRTSGNINVGGSYETYLLVIVDHEGKIVDTRSGRHISDEGIAFIRELGPETLFDRDGNVIGKFERDRAGFSAAAAAATDPGDNF